MPIYKLNGEVYDIPEDVVADFEKDNPNATVTYNANGDEYDIPVSERDSFLKDFPDAALGSGQAVAEQEPAEQKPTPTDKAFDPSEFQQTINSARQTVGQTKQAVNRIGNMQQRMGLDLPQEPIRLGQNKKVTKGEQRFNLDKGEMEQTYVTEAGNEYGTRAAADLEQNAVDAEARREANPFGTFSEDAYQEQRRLDARIEELEAKRNAALKENNGFVYRDKNLFSDEEDEELQNLMSAKRKNDQTVKTLERQKEDYETSGVFESIGKAGGDFFKGMYDAALDPSLLSFGITDLADATQLYKIKRKMDAAKEAGVEPNLTDSEQALLQNTMLSDYAQSEYGKNRSDSYGWGQIAMQAIPFVFEFYLTGGMKTLSDMGAKYGAKKAADLALKGWKAKAVKNLGVAAGDLASGWAMANTTGAAKTAADILDRNIGDVTVDQDGNYYFKDGKSLAESVYEGQLVNTFEYYTEKLGDHLNIGGLFAKGAEKYGLSKLSKAVNFLSGSKALKALGVHDYPSEVIEEEANLLLNATFGLDNNFSMAPLKAASNDILGTNFEVDRNSKEYRESMFNGKTQKDILFGMFFSLGVLNAPRYAQTGYTAAQYKRYENKVNSADAQASSVFGADNWAMIREQIDNCTNDDMAALMQTVSDGKMTPEQKEATARYAANLMTMRGYNSALTAMLNQEDEDTMQAQTSNAVDQGYTEGYDAQEPDEKKMFVDEADAAGQALTQYGQRFADMVTSSQNPVEMMNYLMNNREYFADDEIAAAADYYQKRARAEGVMDAAIDGVDLEVEKANSEVMANTHQATGNVITAQVGDGAYYIIGGDVTTDEVTGMHVVTGTGGAVVVKDAITGEVSVKPAGQVVVTSTTPADDMIQYNENVLRQQLTQQADDDIAYGSPANEVFDLEDTVTLQDGEGGLIDGQVVTLPNAVDGVFVIQTADGRALQMTADDINRRIVAHNGQEVQRNVPETGQNVPNAQEYVPQTPENVPYQGANGENVTQSGVLDNATGENAAAEDAGQESTQPQSALSRIPVRTDKEGQPLKNKKGRPILDWHKASVEDAAAALIETTGGNMVMARDTASDLVRQSQDRKEKIAKQKPKGEDPIEIAESRMEIQQQIDEQQTIIKQWQDVGAAIRKQMETAEAERRAAEEAAKSEEQKAREAEEARIRKEKQDAIDAERRRKKIEEEIANWNKPYAPLVKARKEMEGDQDAQEILSRTEPESLDEWVSSLIQPQSMMWNDETDPVTGRTIIGLQSELGLQKKDIERIGGLIAPSSKGGKPFGQVVHDIWEQLSEGMKNMYDDQDVRNALTSLFGEGNTVRMRHLTEEHRIEEARETMQENLRREAEAELEAWAEAHHLTPEERETFNEWMQIPPTEPEQEVINQIIADNEQNRRSEGVGQQYVSGPDAAGIEGGESQVQQEAETAGNGNPEQRATAEGEAATGEQAPVDDNVPGGESIFVTPKKNVPLSRQLVSDLAEAYASGDPSAIQSAVVAIKAYVDEGGDFENNEGDDYFDYDGNDPQKLALQYKERVLLDRYLDDDEDQEYIKTGLKPEMRQSEQSSQEATIGTLEDFLKAARNGDVDAQKKLESYGLSWEKKPVMRFISQGEFDSIMGGNRYEGRFGNGVVDVTNQEEVTTAASADYRVTFKDELDWTLSDRLQMKNEQLGDGWLKGGYDLNDVAKIEKRNPDGTYSVVYDSSQKSQESEPYSSFEDMVADTNVTVKDSGMKKALRKIVDKVFAHGSSNTRKDPRGFDYKFVYLVDATNKSDRVLLKPWESKGEIEYNDNNPTATWVDEKDQRIYFIKFQPSWRIPSSNFIIAGYKSMPQPIGKTSSPEEIKAEEEKVDTNPTEGQKEAGNYQKGHINVDGYDITIENPKGSVRSGVDGNGNAWEQEMNNTYGYIRGTEGVDGDHIDVFLSDNPASGKVFVVDQVNPNTREFDEHKVMYGFNDATEAKIAYFKNYNKGWKGFGNITEVSREEFKKWVESSHRKTKPFAEYKSVKKEQSKPKPEKQHKRIVSDDQMEDLRKKLREKFGTLNAGIDVERMLLGAMYAVGKIERGVTKFADYAAEMVEEIGDAIRPYLKAFYEAVRNMPEAAEYRDQMTSPEEVAAFDEYNFDKQQKAPDAITKAEQVVQKQKAKQQVKKIEKEVNQKIRQGDLFAGDLFGGEAAAPQQQTEQPKEPVKPKLNKKDYRTYMTPEAREYFANDPRFAKFPHPELAFVTAAVWDGVVIPVEELAKIPAIVEAEQRVKAKEELEPFSLTDEQVEAHAQHLLDAEHGSAVYKEGKLQKVNGHDDFSGPVRQERKAFIIIGRPAGGKSSVFANPLSNKYGARIIDSDTVKEWFDEFDDGYGAGYVQNMSSKVADRALDIAVQNGDNVILPRIGGDSVKIMSAALRLAGYDVQLYYNDVVPDTSYMRSQSRFAMTGRYLSLDYLTSIKDKPSETFSNFAEETIGDYINECSKEQIQKLQGRLERLVGGKRSDLWRALSWSLDEEGRGNGDGTVSGAVERSGADGNASHLDLTAPIFSYAEWKSNDVAFGEDPKEIWNSKSGKPMPGKEKESNENNNELHSVRSEQGLSAEPSPSGEGTGQTSGSAERPGAERGPEQDRAERSGRGHSVETPLVEAGGEVQPIKAVQPPKHNNRRNNVGERGKDYAPLSPKARFNANVDAIKMMRALMDDGVEAPTKDQMEVLRKYSGWGGMGTFFNDATTQEYRTLMDLLDEDEFRTAAMSINSAYFTPAMVIDSMWDIAEAMGFKGGNVLEGSAGIGNIIGQMPRDMSRRSDIEAVEIDKISGNILKLLYPDAKVHIQGFQDTKIPNGSVDLAITNVPFVTGLHVFDKVDKDLSRKFTNIHDFCIAKNIRKLREGGIGIFISSSGTLDKSNDLRAWITDEGQADVVGAFRLNNETFGGTTATSDIIVVRKRVNNQKSPNAIDISAASPMRVGSYEDKFGNEKQTTMTVNDYFQEHPEMMAGEMAFGYEKGDTFRPGSYGLYPVAGKNQEKMLQDFVKSMKKAKESSGIRESKAVGEEKPVTNQLTVEKEGRMLIDDNGRLCVSRMGTAVPLGLNDQKVKGQTKQQCFKDYQEVQKAVDDVLQQQLNDPDDAKLQPKLKALNAAYDKFTKRYGTLHKNPSITFLRNDIDFPSFQALENYSETKDIKGKVTVTTKKAPLFSQRVLGFKTEPKPKTVKDAVIASMFRSNGIDLEWIAGKLSEVAAPPNGDKWTADDVRKGILVSRLGFEDPSTGQIEIRYKYLSGNVREKLAIAEAYNTDGRYAANVEELRKAVPMDIPSHLIEFSIGSSWIPVELYKDYLKENYDLENIKLSHVEGNWVLDEGYGYRNEKNRAAGVYSEQFRETIYGHQLVAAAMNNRPVKVAKQVTEGWGSSKTTRTVVDKNATQACAVRVDEIKDDFKQWAKKKMQDDPELSARIEKIYNDKFNALVPMEIDKELLPEHFEGSNVNITLRPHQKTGTMRGLTAPTMLAHEVGTGKSFTLITTAMEMRRLGTARKPMLVVQNATVAQLTADAKLLYPNAKVLALTERDRDAEGRRAFYASIKYNDWDMIIIPQSTLNMIPDSPERELQFIQEKIDEKKHVIEAAMQSGMDSREIQRLKKELDKLEEEYGDTFLDKDPANGLVYDPKYGGYKEKSDKKKKKDTKREAASLDKAETKAKEQLDRQTDDVQFFDDLGVDALLVDEAHEYKHLGFQTSIGRGIKGVDPSYSKKCAGLYNKTRSVYEKAGWKNVVFATGTPISNTAAEIWTFMKYLMPADMMRANDIYYFDDFVHNFGSISQSLEFATSGKFKENTRFAAYVNKPELIRIWSQVADTVLTKDAKSVQDKLPKKEGGKDQDIFLPQSPSLVRIMAAVRAELERFENMTGQEKKENSSIPLTMYGIAKRAAIDPRLVDPNAPDEPTSKTNSAVKEIVKDLKATANYKGTVAVFCDNQNRLGTNAAGKKVVEFNIYDDMKQKLMAKGVPESQIAIVKSGMSITAKQKIFDAVNAGTIRVVLGSTQTLGTGVNMQERLHLLIHMDAPDRPMDYTQRNGRIERQGNLHKEWGKTIRIVRFGVEDSLDVTAYQRLKTKSGFIDSIMDGKAALANNQVDRTVEEEEEGLFDNPVAVLSGSQYALKKNQAERELRKYQGKKVQWEADQTYVTNQLRHNKREVESTKADIKDEENDLSRIRSMFPDGKVKNITVEGVKIDMTKDSGAKLFGEALKEKVNDPVNAIVKRNRENPIYNDETMEFTIALDGHDVNFKVQIMREAVVEQGKMRTVIHKYTSYSSPDLHLDSMTTSKSVRDSLEEIIDQVVTGQDYQDRIDAYKAKIDRLNAESEQLEKRVGMEFQYGKELEQAQKNVEEYTRLMKQEMEEKEAKYAAQQKEAKENGGFDLSKAEDSEEDDDVRFSADEDWENEEMLNQDMDSMSSQDILLSLSQKDDYERNEAINELVRRVREGDARIVRMGQEMEYFRGSDAQIAGGIVGGWKLASAPLADEALGGMVYGSSALEGGSTSKRQGTTSDSQLAIISWAKATGHYYSEDQVRAESLDKDVWQSAAESRVYRTADGKKVIKFMESWVYFENPLLKRMDDITLQNAAGFEPLTVLGFAEDEYGKLQVVLEQDFVDGVTVDEIFDDEPLIRENNYLDAFMEEELGLDRHIDEEGNLYHMKDGRIFKDIHGGNVIVDSRNRRHVIDCYVSLAGDDRKERTGTFVIEDNNTDNIRHRQSDIFSAGQTFPIFTTQSYSSYDVTGRRSTYSTDLLPDTFMSLQSMLDAIRNAYPDYYAAIDGNSVKMQSWDGVMAEAENAREIRESRPGRAKKGAESYVERKTRRAIDAVNDMARRMSLDVEVLTTTEGLTGKKARSKGWFNPKTHKIVIVLPNHRTQSDVINTLLHEGVAHYGLRKMFGQNFDTFLDNVYNNVSPEIKARIDAAIKRNGWGRHEATEEYLARLAERTDFEHAANSGWWQKIKNFFMEMLAKAGFNTELTDNELRYILWRSYDHLLHPDSRRSIFDTAKEVDMQRRLGINRYARERERLQRTGRTDTSWMAAEQKPMSEAEEYSDAELLHSIRTKEPPKKTGIGYKVFVLKNGQLYPPMVANPGGEGTPVGVWLDADAAPVAGTSKTGRPQVKAGGKGTQGGSGQLAYRPGWHLGTIPYALQFNRKDANGERTLFPNNFVWAEVEYADDVDYQKEAHDEGVNANGKYQHSLAGLKHVPTDGSYKYRTNPDPKTDEWVITGAMRVNRILSREEVDEMVRKAGREPQQVQDGDILTQEAVDALNDEIKATIEADEMGLLYSDPDAWDDVAQQMYENAVARESLKWQEAWQDSMVSLKAIQDAIATETGRAATGAENAYNFENRMHGRAKNMTEQYDWRFYRPMLKAFSDFTKANGMTQEEGIDYLISKSGLERNVYYAFRDAAQAKLTEDIKKEREKLEKAYASRLIDEGDYILKKKEIEDKERNGVDDIIRQVRETLAYQRAKDDYQDGSIGYTEYLRRIESVIRSHVKDYDTYAKDYSGLTETFAKNMYDEAQAIRKAAQRTVDPNERRQLWREYDEKMRQAYMVARQVAEDAVFAAEDGAGDHTELWDKINAATKETLKQSYESGLMDRNIYNKVRAMFDYYIPLRGWEEDKASDVYTYMGKENVFNPAVKKTWGRRSQADNPLAYIGNIAVSTILSGHRNQMKQHFLNYVMNNPTSLVSISESWYENIAPEGESPVWILRTADTAGKSADEIVQIVNDFNDEMRQKQREGKAMPVTGRLRLDVHATSGQKAEHVVEVQRAGHTYQLYINGNPKAAQALNGTAAKAVSRISQTYLGQKITKLNRNMAMFFTSKNPAFVVSNLSRDLNMAGASVALKEGKEDNKRFIANVAKVLTPRLATGDFGKMGVKGLFGKGRGVTGMMPKLLSKWKDGKLDMSDETQRYFKEFMDEGGETGFVNMLSIESFKEKMQKEIREMNGSSILGSRGVKETSVHKALRLLGDTFEFYNRCAEDVTRFIVYMTSRQMGKSLEDSIADAKDVTLNFNRKGTGGLGNAEVRDLFIFVNPAIQALGNMYKMATGNTLKFGVVTAAFMAGGAFMAAFNQWMLNLLGDDDDKEAYWNLPPWVRKNNLVFWIPFTKNFVTIPLAQEFRVFYGVGEMMSSMILDHPVDKWGLEVFSSVADLVPINPTGNGGNLMVDFAPTMVQPLMQVGENVDFTGKPIWKDNQDNKHAPMYEKAYVSTPTWMVKLSEGINDVTGGNEGKKGVVEKYAPFWGDYINNPAVWNHLLQGYFGGMYNTIAKTFDVGVTAAQGELPKIYQTPVVNRFLNRPVERDNAGVLGEEYYGLTEDRDALQYELRTWQKKAADGEEGAQEHVDEILASDEWKRAEVISHYEKIIKDLKAGERAASSNADKTDIKLSIGLYKQQMMEELDAIDEGKEPLTAAVEAFGNAKTFSEKNRLRMRIERLMMRQNGEKPKTKGRSAEVEKALSYITDEERESRDTNDKYLSIATAEDVRDDARIKAAKAKLKPISDEYKRIAAERPDRAADYYSRHAKELEAVRIIDQQSRMMQRNKKLLGKGSDAAIMRLIANSRSVALKAADTVK